MVAGKHSLHPILAKKDTIAICAISAWELPKNNFLLLSSKKF
jgi:hypothetical protein